MGILEEKFLVTFDLKSNFIHYLNFPVSMTSTPNKLIYLDMDDVLCQYTKAHREALLENPKIQYPQSQYGFFRNLEPMKDAIFAVNYLRQQSIFDVYILTAPSVKNPLCYTEKRLWIEDHLGFEMVERLIISPNKGLSMGDYLIDDHKTGRGQENFKGELLQFGTPGFENWQKVLNYFKAKYIRD